MALSWPLTMAMAKPVVVSAQALEGIDAVAGVELVLAEDAAQFIVQVSALLAQAVTAVPAIPAIGAAARARVQCSYSWSSNLSRIDARLEADATAVTGSHTPPAAPFNAASTVSAPSSCS